MNPVCTFIEFIRNLTDEDYGHNISYFPSKMYFKNGGCYELVKTIKYFLPNSEIYMSNDYKHCVVCYKGILYDVDGVVEDNTNYHLATEVDLMYLDDPYFYGRSEIKFDYMNPSEALTQNISKCRIENLIEECRKMDATPNYYKQRQKVKK